MLATSISSGYFLSIDADQPSFFSSCRARTGNRDNTAPDTPPVPDIRRTRIAASAGTLKKR